jgi:isocitrate/isopropylmalate dehydrogenase
MAAMFSAAMMLEHLECVPAARAIEQAVTAVLAEGQVRTPDLGGDSTTRQVTEAVLGKLGAS